ncbi:MAG: hypothetical protein J6C17_02355 [Clostridia bacterium]|nr:hypothetical protein [Clostridia bacterium]
MEDIKLYTCCFFGHRKIKETDELKSKLYNEIETLITYKKVHTFLFGSKSQFDDLCYKIVTELKEKYQHIKRIYVRAEFPYIDDSYKNYLLESYEDTYYPSKMIDAGKAAYVERNYEMIDNSSYCICYYDENYMPPRRKNSRRDLTDYQPKSGTGIAFDYARKKELNIINLK